MKLKDIEVGETYRIDGRGRSRDKRGGIGKAIGEDYITDRWGTNKVRGLRIVWVDDGTDWQAKPYKGQETVVRAQRVIATEADWQKQQAEEDRQAKAYARRRREQVEREAKEDERLAAECEELGIPYGSRMGTARLTIKIAPAEVVKLVRAAKAAGVEVEEEGYKRVVVKEPVTA